MRKYRDFERGSITVEASLILVIFIFGWVAITSIADFIGVQMIMQYNITQAAKQISTYSYLLSKTDYYMDGQNLKSAAENGKDQVDETIDTVVKLYKAVDETSGNLQTNTNSILGSIKDGDLSVFNKASNAYNQSVEDMEKVYSKAETAAETFSEIAENPEAMLKAFAAIAKNAAYDGISSIVVMGVAKNSVDSQLRAYGIHNGKDVLERLGVVNGADGIHYYGSGSSNGGKVITVCASYTVKVDYPFIKLHDFHFTQTATTQAWGSTETSGKPWRKG